LPARLRFAGGERLGPRRFAEHTLVQQVQPPPGT
jgi:hypothetical protein